MVNVCTVEDYLSPHNLGKHTHRGEGGGAGERQTERQEKGRERLTD